MNAEFIIGRECSDKEGYVLSQIKEIIKNDPLSPVTVLVSPQATYLTEKKIIKALGLSGIMGISVMGPEKLTQKICDSVFGRAKKLISPAGRCMAAHISASQNAERIKAIAKCFKAADIWRNLSELFSELKTLDVSPDDLAVVELADKASKEKLADIALLYGAYNEFTEKLGVTAGDRTNIAIERVRDAAFIRESHVFVLEFDMLTTQMARYAAELCMAAKSCRITLAGDKQGDPLFAVGRQVRRKIEEITGKLPEIYIEKNKKKSGDILYLERSFYSSSKAVNPLPEGDIYIADAQNEPEEVRGAAEIIARLTAKGYEYNDIAVLCGDTGTYAPHIKRVFSAAGIPYFLDEKRSLRQSALCGFILSGLALCRGSLSREKVVKHIKYGFLGTEEQRDIIECYAFENISNPYQFLKEFKDEDAECARACLEPLWSFRNAVRKAKTAGEIISALSAYLEEINAAETVNKTAEELKQTDAAAADFHLQLYEGVQEILAQAQMLMGGEKCGVLEAEQLLESGFSSVEISLIPVLASAVTVGGVTLTRLPDIKALIVLGVNEGVLPDYEEKTDLLTPKERAALLESVGGITEAKAMLRQKLAIYRAISAPSKKLFLCYSHTPGGKQCEPSVIIERVRELCAPRELCVSKMRFSLEENVRFKAREQIACAAAGKGMPKGDYLSLLLGGKMRQAALFYEKAASYRALGALESAQADALYTLDSGSVTRYETFFTCPFKHFMRYGIKPKVLYDSTLNSFDMGSFVHYSLEGFCKRLDAQSLRWDNIENADMERLLRESIDEVRQKSFKYGLEGENEFTALALEEEIRRAAYAVRYQLENSQSRFLESEKPFEQEIGGVKIKGVIDRIDTAKLENGEYFRIIDYKTGDKSFSLQDLVYGISLQLCVYMIAAFARFRGRKEFAGATYFIVSLPYLEEADSAGLMAEYKMSGIYTDDPNILEKVYGREESEMLSIKLRMTKKGFIDKRSLASVYSNGEIRRMCEYTQKMIERAASGIRAGNIAAEPKNSEKHESCANCEYAGVCLTDGKRGEKNTIKLSRDNGMEIIEEALK